MTGYFLGRRGRCGSVRWLALGVVMLAAACAPAPSLQRPMIGTQEQAGEVALFASRQELVVAGVVNEAMQLVKNNRLFDAERRLRQALALQPESEQIRFDLAVVLTQIGQPEEAQELLRVLREQRPGTPGYLLASADAALAVQQPLEARRFLKEAFVLFKRAENAAAAARVARSIANIDFEVGYEQEALCYSFEAYALAPGAEQLGWHARLLVARNLHRQAVDLITTVLKEAPTQGSSPLVQHALALARFASGDTAGAVAAEESALDLLSLNPELGAELNAAWWLMAGESLVARRAALEQREMQAARGEGGESVAGGATWSEGDSKKDEARRESVAEEREQVEQLAERLASMYPEVLDFGKQGGLFLTTWPKNLRELLLAPRVPAG